jgi:hypothetical protein
MSSLSRLSAQAKAAIERALNAFRQGRPIQRPDDGSRVLPPPVQEKFDEIELLGRDASYEEDGLDRVFASNERVVKSSNVYSYAYEFEKADTVILYVTFLFWAKGVKPEDRKGPGSSYAYYNVPRATLNAFASAAESSAGRAVWDYLRIRGTIYGHQVPYRLVQSVGDYVPRKATAGGFRRRFLVSPGMSPSERQFAGRLTFTGLDSDKPGRTFRESTLTIGQQNANRTNRKPPDRGRASAGRADNGRRPPNRG